MTRVGLFTFLMTLAIVYVLPEPVTPRRVWCRAPDNTPSVSFAMACGWSPAGSNGAASLNISQQVSFDSAVCQNGSGELSLPYLQQCRSNGVKYLQFGAKCGQFCHGPACQPQGHRSQEEAIDIYRR